ncbi:tRNA (guanine-N(7)-)-methyltransferase (tRNA(m7G46)-methyltransferase) [Rhodotorula kratochvilovae]
MTQTKAAWEATPDSARPSLPGAPPFLERALDSLLALILRDFVLKWYSALSDSPVFPAAVDRTIRDTLVALSGRVAKVDWSEVLVGRILPLVTSHLENFRVADEAVRAGFSDSDETDLFVASRYASAIKGGKLHPAVDAASTNSRPAEEAWLRELFGGVLPLIVPEREMESAAVRVMVREIVACAVLLPVFELLSDPDWYNRMIDDKAGAAIRDQKMVNEFREALDKQGPALAAANFQLTSPKTPPPARKTEVVSVRTSTRQFDAWLASISTVKTLGDARRLRSDVTAQIRKAKLATDGKSLDEVVDGVKVVEWVDFIERLYTAKRKIDRRIAKLGGTDYQGRAPSVMTSPDSHLRPVRLRDLLLEPIAVTYLMEFLERRRHSARAQFWLLVEGLKDPLEELDADQPATTTSAPEHGATALDDIRMIWDAYLTSDPFRSSPAHLQTVRLFVEREAPTVVSPQDIRQVRHALFAIQADVLVLLEEEDLPAFRRSDLYFKAVATLPVVSPAPSAVLTPPTPAAVLPPARPRSRSNPPVPPLRKSSSPSPSNRTDTAPPQVTFHAAFNRPSTRRGDLFDDEAALRDPVRKVSGGSFETVASAASAPPMARRKSTLADSLEFLMSPPADEVDRSPLFGAEHAADDTGGEPADVDGDPPSDDDYVQVQTIEAIQEALNSILATDARAQPHSGKSSASLASLQDGAGASAVRRTSADGQRRATLPAEQAGASSPSTATSPTGTFSRRPPTREGTRSPPPLPARPRPRAVFDDDETLADVDVDEPAEPDFDPHSIVLPAPGDLHLPAEIVRLTESLAKLKNQEAVVEALIRKAELTGNASELKLLVKSRESLRREIRAASFQKDQYEAQASENELSPDRTRVTIPGTTVGQAGPGAQSFQLYLVEVHQLAADGSFRAGWIVTRRYSEFSALYSKLRDKYVAARYLDFPSKRLVGIWSKEFIEQRREGLERYLQSLLKIPVICRSSELRAFLSQQTIALPKSDAARKVVYPLLPGQAFRNLYRGLTSGIDDVLGTSTTSMVDAIVDRLGQQAAEFAGLSGGKFSDEDLVGQLAGSGAPGSLPGTPGEEGLTYFTAPICDLFITIFELKERNNWLRRQAILIVLQQVLGGTIERKFRDGVKMLLAPPQLVGYISTLQNAMWPNGELKPKEPPRTPAQKAATKESAARKLATLMPDVAANLIGRHNAKQGARRLFAVLQNRRLNKHIIYSVVDEVVAVLFPEPSEQRNRPLFIS